MLLGIATLPIARTYLDYNASAPLLPQARAAMIEALEADGNPSSVHAEGRRVRAIVERAREQVAALVKTRPGDVIFTSGASEANVTALSAGWHSVLVAGIEHDSVLAPIRASGARVIEVPVSKDGVVDAGFIGACILREGPALGRAVVALQMVNNETGAVQPVAEVAAFCREHGAFCHTDAVQAAGRIAMDISEAGVDTLALSAHKIGGPKGVGALVVRDDGIVHPLITGGGQERRRRAGTESVAAIAGFGAAAEAAANGLADVARIAALRDRLERGLLEAVPGAVIFSRDVERVANTSCVGVAGKTAEIIVIRLDVAGFAVSAGSACSSGKVGASHVLAAMSADEDVARGAIRISIGPATTPHEIDAFIGAWSDIQRPVKSGQQIKSARAGAGLAAIGES